ncbi:MAG: DUF1367 family protein [Prevotellaceae bacterium]|nr:DUF1367 family protein [Prevotellaceae bacterium]
MEIYCMVTPQGLTPLYDSDLEAKKKLKTGTIVRCAITKPRNIGFHKKFFALLRLTYDNLPENLVDKLGIHTEYDMLRRFKLDLGLFDTFLFPDENGEKVIQYHSISFAAMDDNEFEKFYEGCVHLVLTRYLKGITREEIKEEIENFR